jgi:predicted transcriptional regulator
MAETPTSPVVWVQVMQALVARELVEGFGLSERQTAVMLGIVPSSVSQYLSGKRLGPTLSKFLDDDEARRLARRTAQQLMAGAVGSRAVLEAAIALGERVRPPDPRATSGATSEELSPVLRRKIPGWLRDRIAGEQNAVAECMRLAQRSRDELTRALFRQIASDSLRHAEIVASLAAYLDRGVSTSAPTGITRADVEDLIRREHEAEETSEIDLGPELGGMMRILWESMESDEKKHERLLELLLDAGLVDRGTDRKIPPRTPRTSARHRRP